MTGNKGQVISKAIGLGSVTRVVGDLIALGTVAVAGTAIKLLEPRPQKTWPASRNITVIDTMAALPIVYGRARLPGKLAEMVSQASASSSDHFWLWIVLALCHGPIAGIDELYFDGQLVLAADGTFLPPFTANPFFYAKYVGATNQDTGTTGKQIGPRQRVTLSGGADADTYTLSYAGQSATGIRKDASAATLQSDLEALSTIGSGNVTVSGAAKGPYTIVFRNARANVDGPFLIASAGTGGLTGVATSLTGGSLTAADLIAADPGWDAQHKGAGIAYLILKMHFRSEQFPSGVPQVEAIVRGRTVKDIRTGVTGYAVNPALIWRDYATDPVYGHAMPEADVIDGDASDGVWAEADYYEETTPQPQDTGMWAIHRFGTAGSGTTLDRCCILQKRAGLGTVSCAAGPATFSLSQAGILQNGGQVIVGGTWYVVSAFDGTTHGTLAGSPTFGASAFTLAPALLAGQLIWIQNATGQTHSPNGQWPVLEVFAGTPAGADGLAFTLDNGAGVAFEMGNGFGGGYGTNDTGTVQQAIQAQRFTAQGILDGGQTHRTNLQAILAAARADMFTIGGKNRLYTRRVRSPEPLELDPTTMDPGSFSLIVPGATDAPNRLRVSYTDPAKNWQRQTFPWPPSSAANPYLAADNNVLSERAIDLVMCYDRHQAERVAMVLLEEARAAIGFTASTREAALQLAVDDIVNVTHRTPGWGATETNIRAITSSSVANPSVLYAPGHGLANGQRARIRGHTGSTPSLNHDYYVTLVDGDHVSVPVNVTVGGTDGTIAPAPMPCWTTGIGIRPMAESNPISLSGMRYVPTVYDDQMTPDSDVAPATNLPGAWDVPAAPTNLVLTSGTADPTIRARWDASTDARVWQYEIWARRSDDPNWHSWTVSLDTLTTLVLPVADQETWSVWVRAVTRLGIASDWLTGDHTASVISGATFTYVVTADGSSVTYTITFGPLCGSVALYTRENSGSGGANPLEAAVDLVGPLLRPPSGVLAQRVATTAGYYRRTRIIGYSADGVRGQDSGVVETQATASGGGPSGSPSALAHGTLTATTIPITWANGDASALTRVYVNGTIVKPDVAAGATSYTITGLTPGIAYQVDVDHFKNGQASTKAGVQTWTTTSVTLDAPTSFVATGRGGAGAHPALPDYMGFTWGMGANAAGATTLIQESAIGGFSDAVQVSDINEAPGLTTATSSQHNSGTYSFRSKHQRAGSTDSAWSATSVATYGG